jgi:hypothetical protein
MKDSRLPQPGQQAAAPPRGASSQALSAAHPVTHQRDDEENEDRFELAGSDGYATVVDQGYRVWILEFWVPPGQRGDRHATALLEAVIAHFTGRVLALSAEPFRWDDDEPPGLDAAQLAAWYARHGFSSDGQRHQMTRLPGTTCSPPQPTTVSPQPTA